MNRTVFKISSIAVCWIAIIWRVATFPQDDPAPVVPAEEARPRMQQPDELPMPSERDIIGVQLTLAQEWPKLRPKSHRK